jgi:hypothetical protein
VPLPALTELRPPFKIKAPPFIVRVFSIENKPVTVRVPVIVFVVDVPEKVKAFFHVAPFVTIADVALIVSEPDPVTLDDIVESNVTLPDTVIPLVIVMVFVYPVKSILLHTAATLTVQLGEVALKVAVLVSVAVGTAPRDQFVAVPQLLLVVPVNIFAAIS